MRFFLFCRNHNFGCDKYGSSLLPIAVCKARSFPLALASTGYHYCTYVFKRPAEDLFEKFMSFVKRITIGLSDVNSDEYRTELVQNNSIMFVCFFNSKNASTC
jgi:hypothetical protein